MVSFNSLALCLLAISCTLSMFLPCRAVLQFEPSEDIFDDHGLAIQDSSTWEEIVKHFMDEPLAKDTAGQLSSAHLEEALSSSIEEVPFRHEDIGKQFHPSVRSQREEQESDLSLRNDLTSAKTIGTKRYRGMIDLTDLSDNSSPKKMRIQSPEPALLVDAVKNNDIETASELLDYFSRMRIQLDGGQMVKLALKAPDRNMLQLFLEHGINPNIEIDWSGSTILFDAIQRRNHQYASLLMQKGANVNARTSHGFTPISVASSIGDIEMVWALLKAGADPDLAFSGKHPLTLALERKDLTLARAIIEQSGIDQRGIFLPSLHLPEDSASTTLNQLLFEAVARGNHQFVELLLQHGADVTAKDAAGTTPISLAALLGDKELVKKLDEMGPKVFSAKEPNNLQM